MPNFAANISMMYSELDFFERFGAAANAGFKGVEILFPYEYSALEIKQKCIETGLSLALFNTPPGILANGDRGLAAVPGEEERFDAAFNQAMEYAEILGTRCVHVMSGIVPDGGNRRQHQATLVSNLKRAAPVAAERGKTLLIEPINTFDVPGYFLNYQAQARSVIDEVGADNVKLQFDIYHCQIMEGNLAARLKEYFDLIAHIQVAGNPGRHEPDIGEINYPFLFNLIDDLGYDGWVGCEYKPKAGTESGLGWLKRP